MAETDELTAILRADAAAIDDMIAALRAESEQIDELLRRDAALLNELFACYCDENSIQPPKR